MEILKSYKGRPNGVKDGNECRMTPGLLGWVAEWALC